MVGVVEDTAYTDVRWKDHTMYFVPIMQRNPSDKDPIEKDLSLYAGTMVLETARPMSELETITRRTLAEINPNLTVVKFQTLRCTDRRAVYRRADGVAVVHPVWRISAAAGDDWSLWGHRIRGGSTDF